jgi:hypothetical protein
VWYWPRDPPRGFRETRAQDGGQVFGGYAVRVQVDCTQRLIAGRTAGVAGRPHQLGKLRGA